MEVIFVPVYYKKKVQFEKIIDFLAKRNCKKIGIAYIINYKKIAVKVVKELKEKGFEVFLGKGAIAKFEGQVLGCDALAVKSISNKVDCLLFIGDGTFHLKEVLKFFKKPIYRYNPINEEIEEINFSVNEKKLFLKFVNKVGIVTSIKRGQERIKECLKLKEKLEREGKEVYLFIGNEINENSLLPFAKDIEVFINLSCPRVIENFERIKVFNIDQVIFD